MGSVETIPQSEGGLTYELQKPKPGVSWESMGFTPSEGKLGFCGILLPHAISIHDLILTCITVNGHIECHYHTKSGAWSEPRVVANAHVKVHGLSPALNYGQQAFEGLRVHRDQSGRIRLFRMAAHAARFARSTAAVDIPNVPAALFARAVRLAVALNSEFVPPFEGGCSMYVRPLAYAPGPIMNMYAPDHFVFCVFVTPVSRLYSPVGLRALVIDDFGRTAPRGTGAVKVGGNYGPTLPIMHRAREKGYNLTLHLDSSTNSFIHEFSASGFIGVRREQDGSHVVVIPRDPDILPSITVDSTGVIAESLGWKVERRQVILSFL